VISAYSDASGCGQNLAQDVVVFQDAAASRRKLLARLAQLPGRSALPSTMLSDLTAAWQTSASVDEGYARWARDELTDGCSSTDPNLAATANPNAEATTEKTAFVQLWDPLAESYHLTTYQQDEI
jgi:hypothetical protein